MDDFDRTLIRVTFVVTLVCIGVVSFWMVTAYSATNASCDLVPGNIGDASVSWFPPGRVCTYGNGAFVDTPSYLRVVVLFIAAIGLPFTWWMHRSLTPVSR